MDTDRSTSPAVSRRTVLKGTAGAIAGATALSASLAQASTGRAPFFTNLNQDGGELVIYYWRDPWISDVVPMFEEETGITVTNMGVYSSNDEWWARLQAGETWDFFVPTSEWVERAMKADLLHPLDLSLIPNTKHIFEDYQHLDMHWQGDDQFAVAFSRVYYCLTYNTNEFASAPTTWELTWNEEYANRITMQDNALARISTTALLLGDEPFAPTDWDAISDKLLDQNELVLKYWKDYQNGMELFVNEDVVLGQLTDGRTRMGASQGGAMDWTVPEEGCLAFLDTFAVPANAENPENGMKFIDFLHRPEIMAMHMEGMGYDTVNQAAWDQLDPDLRKQFEIPEDANTVLVRDIDPQVRSRMDEMWTEIQLS